ncbi:MAG TPA: hypothetical protein VFC74_03630 [Oscillospiraceae bacterium]|nr:hypothetical protein [Oscillospiraceae bacterium]
MIGKTLRNHDGVALITVIGVFVIIMIISLSVATLFANNLKQVTHQEYQTRAYYLALSGVDLAYEALVKEPADEDEDSLLDEFIGGSLTELEDQFTIGEDRVVITISAFDTGSTREVKIHSIGTVVDTGNSESLTLIFEAENPLVRRWQ